MSHPCCVVFDGHEPRVYYNWPDYHRQVYRFRGACYKKYNSYEEGIAAIKSRPNSNIALAHDDDFYLQNPIATPPSVLQNYCNCSPLNLCLSPMEEALSLCTDCQCDG